MSEWCAGSEGRTKTDIKSKCMHQCICNVLPSILTCPPLLFKGDMFATNCNQVSKAWTNAHASGRRGGGRRRSFRAVRRATLRSKVRTRQPFAPSHMARTRHLPRPRDLSPLRKQKSTLDDGIKVPLVSEIDKCLERVKYPPHTYFEPHPPEKKDAIKL